MIIIFGYNVRSYHHFLTYILNFRIIMNKTCHQIKSIILLQLISILPMTWTSYRMKEMEIRYRAILMEKGHFEDRRQQIQEWCWIQIVLKKKVLTYLWHLHDNCQKLPAQILLRRALWILVSFQKFFHKKIKIIRQNFSNFLWYIKPHFCLFRGVKRFVIQIVWATNWFRPVGQW